MVGAAGDHPVCSIGLLPDLRIAELVLIRSLRQVFNRQDRVRIDLLVIQPISDRNALSLEPAADPLIVQLADNACVDQHLPSVRHCDRGSGEAAILVVCLIRCQRCRQIPPVKQIIRHGMTPVHRSPDRIIRIVLIEQVILSLVPGKSVRVIHPAHPRGQVEMRPCIRGDAASHLFFVLSCVFQYFAHVSLLSGLPASYCHLSYASTAFGCSRYHLYPYGSSWSPSSFIVFPENRSTYRSASSSGMVQKCWVCSLKLKYALRC